MTSFLLIPLHKKRSIFVLISTITSLVLLLSACATPFKERSVNERGPIPTQLALQPLPADAKVISPSQIEGSPVTGKTCVTKPTLRPIALPANKLIPKIVRRGRIVVGVDQSSNLFSFLDPVNGQLVGFDVDIAREISRDIFGSPDRVDFRILDSSEKDRPLDDGTVDIVINTLSMSCDRQQHIRFSSPYLVAQERILTVKGSRVSQFSNLSGKRVCGVTDTIALRRLRVLSPQTSILAVRNWADCLVAIQQDQVDAVNADDVLLAGLATQDPYLVIVGDPLTTDPYSVAIAPSTPANNTDNLLRQINGTIARILRDGTWYRLHSKWLSGLSETPYPPAATYLPESS